MNDAKYVIAQWFYLDLKDGMNCRQGDKNYLLEIEGK
jgi:hypothetical protein